MRVSNSGSMYPVIHSAGSSFGLTTSDINVRQSRTASIDKIVDYLIEQKNKSTAKPGKGFYIIINYPNPDSFDKNLKSTLSPMQEKINKTYDLNPKKEPGLLVDMIV